MRLITLLSLIGLSLAGCQTVNQNSNTMPTNPSAQTEKYSDSTLIVYYQADKKDNVLKALKQLNLRTIYQYDNMNSVAVQITPNDNIEKMQQKIAKLDGVNGVNRDRILELH